MEDRTRGVLEMAGAMAISSTIGWLVVRSDLPPVQIAFWRSAFGAVVLFATCAAGGQLAGLLDRRLWLHAVAGGAAIALNWLLLFEAFPRASISIATAVYSMQPFVLVGLGALFLGERPRAVQLAWLASAFVGLLLIIGSKPEASYVAGNYALGVLMAFGAACFYAIAAVSAKLLKGTSPLLITVSQLICGCVLLAPFAGLVRLPTNADTWSLLVIAGVAHTALVFVLQYDAVQRIPTYLVGSLYYVYPVGALLIDLAVFGHSLTAMQFAGAALILFSAAAATLGLHSRRAPHERESSAGIALNGPDPLSHDR